MRRAALILFCVLIPVLAGGAAAAWIYRIDLARIAIDDGLARTGLTAASYEIERLDLTGARLRNVALADGLAGEAIDVAYDLSTPWAPRLGEIRLTRPRLDLSAPAVRALFAGDDEGGGDGFDPGPLALHVTGGELDWQSPLGPLRIALDGKAHRAADGTYGIETTLVARAERGRVEATLELAGSPAGDVTGAARLSGGFLEFEQARVDGLTGDIGFTVAGGAMAALHVELAELALSLDGERVARGALSLSRQGDIVLAGFAGSAFGAEGGIEVSGIPNLEAGLIRLQRLSIEARAPHHAALWRHAGTAAPTAGAVAVSLAGHDLSLDVAALGAAPLAALPAVLADGQLSGVVEIKDLALPGLTSNISGAANLDIAAPAGELEASLAVPALFTVGAIDRAAFTGWTPPADMLDGGGSLAIAPTPALRLRPLRDPEGAISGLALSGGAQLSLSLGAGFAVEATTSLEGRLDQNGLAGRLTAAPTTARLDRFSAAGHRMRRLAFTGALGYGDKGFTAGGRLSGEYKPRVAALPDLGWIVARLPLEAAFDGSRLTLGLRAPGDLRLPAIRLGEKLTLPAPTVVTLAKPAGPVLDLDTGSGQFALNLPLRATAFPLQVRTANDTLALEVAPGAVAVTFDDDGSRIALSGGALSLPAEGVYLQGIDAAITDLATAEFKVGQIDWTDAPVELPALLALGRARIGDEDLGVGLSLLDAEQRVRLDATLRHHLDEATTEVEATLVPLDFTPDGLQPGDLATELEILTDVIGQLSGGVKLSLRDGELTGTGVLELADIAFETEAASVDGLDVRFEFDRIWPPRTARPAVLRIANVVSGVEASEVSAELSLAGDATRPLILGVDEAQATTPFARVTLDPLRIDATSGRHDMTVRLSEVDLAALLSRLDVEGVAGSGRLSGAIPITVLEDNFTVTDGRLAAEAPGVIKISVEALNQSLTGTAEQVKLLLTALEDFHYSSLVLALEKPADGGGRLKLFIDGHNPAVLNGHPFDVNIDLRGRFDDLLDTALRAYRLSDQAIRATVK